MNKVVQVVYKGDPEPSERIEKFRVYDAYDISYYDNGEIISFYIDTDSETLFCLAKGCAFLNDQDWEIILPIKKTKYLFS